MADRLREHQFQPGQSKPEGSGRRTGSRNKLSTAFFEAFAKDFEEHGADAIKICRMEEPARYLQVAAMLLPKAFDDEMPARVIVTTGVLRDGDAPAPPGPPSIPGPKSTAALPKPEPVAEAQPLMTADLVAPLPRADDVIRPQPAEPAKAEAREKLIYEKPVVRTGWR